MLDSRIFLIVGLAAATAAAIPVAPATAAPTTVKFGAIESGQIVREDESTAFTTTSPTFVDIPGATITIVLNDSKKRVLIARAAGETECTSGIASNVGNWCSLQVVSNKNGGAFSGWVPDGGTGFALQTIMAANTSSYAGASMMRSRIVQGPGTFVVKLQGAVHGPNTIQLWFDDWSFEVDVAQVQ